MPLPSRARPAPPPLKVQHLQLLTPVLHTTETPLQSYTVHLPTPSVASQALVACVTSRVPAATQS
jgi:hypothetical protein